MKQNKLYAVLAAAGVLCLAAQLGDAALPEIFTAVSAFPFDQIGLGLRALSLSGRASRRRTISAGRSAAFMAATVCVSRTR